MTLHKSAGPDGTTGRQPDAVIEQETQHGLGDAGPTAGTLPDRALPGTSGPEIAAKTASEPSNDISLLLSKMEERILDAFEQKLAFDASKEKQIGRLHEELQGYRSDLVAKCVRPVLQSLIRLHDDVGKVLDSLALEDPSRVTADRLLGLLKGFHQDIELALGHNGVTAYRNESDTFDPRRQRVLRTVNANDQSQVGQVAARVRPGFEHGDTIIEKERVAVFAMPQTKAGQKT
ncbi:MAG: nucleotide exchange factor GrpE [Bradyrhizobium sp.]